MGTFVLMATWMRGCSLEVVEAGEDGEPKTSFYFTVFFPAGTVPLGQHLHPTTASILLPTAPYIGKLTVCYST